MILYNSTYRHLANNWGNATDTQKHSQVKVMFETLSTTTDQNVEFATLDFMDRYVYGTNTTVDSTSLKCDRGFANYCKHNIGESYEVVIESYEVELF